MSRNEIPAASDLRYRITIQKPVNSQNEMGGLLTKWEDVMTVWAAIDPYQSRAFFSSHREQNERIIEFVIRYREGISVAMRIVFKERYYRITSIRSIKGSKREIVLRAKKNH